MKNLTAEQVIEKIKDETTKVFGQVVKKNNYAIEIRGCLQDLAEANKISPSTYKKALDLTFSGMSPAEKTAEQEKLTGA